jgi:hypothetical protein
MTPCEKAYRERIKRQHPVGTRFERLTVVRHERRNDGRWLLICKCTCGKIKKVDRACDLRHGYVKSCGCLNRELASKRRLGKPPPGILPVGQAGLRLALRNYKLWAQRRNLTFELTDEEFFKLSRLPCTYCGSPPEQRNCYGKYNKGCVMNGIDRQNTLLGYTKNNSVPCCKHCNRAKWRMTVPEFKAWIQRAATHLKINVSC